MEGQTIRAYWSNGDESVGVAQKDFCNDEWLVDPETGYVYGRLEEAARVEPAGEQS